MRKCTLVEIQKECEREKSFKFKRLELEEDKVRVEDKPFFLSQIMDLNAFNILICPKIFLLSQ
jgi:hypothetical protein